MSADKLHSDNLKSERMWRRRAPHDKLDKRIETA